MESKFDVVIVGSGLSGMSCAVSLVDKGYKVLVVESRNVIGGRTSSWNEGGMEVESGLHRFLGFFEVLPALMEKVGMAIDDLVVWEDEIEIRLPDLEPAVFGLSAFKPLKSVAGIIGNNDFISPVEKTKLAKFFAQGFADFKTRPEDLDNFSVKTYALQQHLDHSTIERILVPLTEGLFFFQ